MLSPLQKYPMVSDVVNYNFRKHDDKKYLATLPNWHRDQLSFKDLELTQLKEEVMLKKREVTLLSKGLKQVETRQDFSEQEKQIQSLKV
jgi:hypothetical protein